jgi:hypothetical protein
MAKVFLAILHTTRFSSSCGENITAGGREQRRCTWRYAKIREWRTRRDSNRRRQDPESTEFHLIFALSRRKLPADSCQTNPRLAGSNRRFWVQTGYTGMDTRSKKQMRFPASHGHADLSILPEVCPAKGFIYEGPKGPSSKPRRGPALLGARKRIPYCRRLRAFYNLFVRAVQDSSAVRTHYFENG